MIPSRSSIGAVLLMLASVAQGSQSHVGSQGEWYRPVTSPPRYAGAFSWDGRQLLQVSALTSVELPVYDNTCSPNYYLQLGGDYGDVAVDSGRLPSPSSPVSSTSATGCATAYTLTGLRFGYCTPNVAPITVVLKFYDCLWGCNNPTSLTPAQVLSIPGLPGSSAPGQSECWIVDLLLDETTLFSIEADCDGVYDGTPFDNFGWSFEIQESGEFGYGGPLVGGEPFCHQSAPAEICQFGEGTVFANLPAPAGTGYGNMNVLAVFKDGVLWACFQNTHPCSIAPWAGIYLQLRSPDCPPPPGLAFCSGDGSATPCPCGNESQHPEQGCTNSTGTGVVLSATGNASVTSDTLRLWAEHQVGDGPLLLYQGTGTVNGGAGAPFGDGLRCVGGATTRLGVRTPFYGFVPPWGPGLSSMPHVQVGASVHYQLWYRDVGGPCNSGFNLSGASTIYWAP